MSRPLSLLHRRALSLALGLLLLLTQQLGLRHLLSHAAAGATGPAAVAAVDHTPRGDAAADGLCQVCLALAAIGLAALPASWRWLAPRLPVARPTVALVGGRLPGASAAYLARAPPHLA